MKKVTDIWATIFIIFIVLLFIGHERNKVVDLYKPEDVLQNNNMESIKNDEIAEKENEKALDETKIASYRLNGIFLIG